MVVAVASVASDFVTRRSMLDAHTDGNSAEAVEHRKSHHRVMDNGGMDGRGLKSHCSLSWAIKLRVAKVSSANISSSEADYESLSPAFQILHTLGDGFLTLPLLMST